METHVRRHETRRPGPAAHSREAISASRTRTLDRFVRFRSLQIYSDYQTGSSSSIVLVGAVRMSVSVQGTYEWHDWSSVLVFKNESTAFLQRISKSPCHDNMVQGFYAWLLRSALLLGNTIQTRMAVVLPAQFLGCQPRTGIVTESLQI